MNKNVFFAVLFSFTMVLLYLFQMMNQTEAFSFDMATISSRTNQAALIVTAVVSSVFDKINIPPTTIVKTVSTVGVDNPYLLAQCNFWNDAYMQQHSSPLLKYYTENMIYGVIHRIMVNNSSFFMDNPAGTYYDFFSTMKTDLSDTLITTLFPTSPTNTPCDIFFLTQVKSPLVDAITIFNHLPEGTQDSEYISFMEGKQHTIPVGGTGYYFFSETTPHDSLCANGYFTYPDSKTYVCN